MLDNSSWKTYTRICNTYCYPWQQWLHSPPQCYVIRTLSVFYLLDGLLSDADNGGGHSVESWEGCRSKQPLPSLGCYPDIWGSPVGIVTRVRAGRSGVRVPVRARDYSSPKRPERVWSSPRLIFILYWLSSPGVNWPGREVNHSAASSARLRMSGIIHLFLVYAFTFARRDWVEQCETSVSGLRAELWTQDVR